VKLTLAELNKRVHNEHDAYLLLEELRWKGTPICPHCGNDKAYFIRPRSENGMRGTGAKDANGKQSQSIRRIWKCAKCRMQFSVLTGTVFHGTHVPLSTWLTVMVQMCAAKNGMSAREVERMHGVTPETAWYMLHRLREAMKREPIAAMLEGVIVADEAWIGGANKNKHKKDRIHGGGPGAGKTAILTLVDKHTGEARSRVIPDVTGPTLAKAISEQVRPTQSLLWTDESTAYPELGHQFLAHETVNHSQDKYVSETGAGTNLVEGFFSQLKRSIDGTHHHVSTVHLQRYLDEFDFRYTTRKLSDSLRMQQMIDQAHGRRLTYKPLTGQ
jgi:transposase-like protein